VSRKGDKKGKKEHQNRVEGEIDRKLRDPREGVIELEPKGQEV